MVLFNTCCGFRLETGGKIIGTFGLMSSVAFFAYLTWSAFFHDLHKSTAVENGIEKAHMGVFLDFSMKCVFLIIASINILTYSSLLLASFLKCWWATLPYLIINGFELIMIYFIFVTEVIIMTSFDHTQIILDVIIIIVAWITGYSYLCIVSLCQHLLNYSKEKKAPRNCDVQVVESFFITRDSDDILNFTY